MSVLVHIVNYFVKYTLGQSYGTTFDIFVRTISFTDIIDLVSRGFRHFRRNIGTIALKRIVRICAYTHIYYVNLRAAETVDTIHRAGSGEWVACTTV